jgi:hypothetical protein
LLSKDIDDGLTEMIKSFTWGGLVYTNILVHGISWETIRESMNCSNTLLKNGQTCSSYCIILEVEVGIHILNRFNKPKKHMRTTSIFK